MARLEREDAARLQLARQLLQQRSAMLRVGLAPVDYLCWRMGCSIVVAERLVERVADEEGDRS